MLKKISITYYNGILIKYDLLNLLSGSYLLQPTKGKPTRILLPYFALMKNFMELWY